MPKDTFTKNLNHLLAQRNLTQEEFASKLGMSRAAAGPWVRGAAVPKLRTLVDIADIFNITVEKLMRQDLTQPVCHEHL
jgi:transcriptional regulator with XRE-family HTH domain